jgi:hypothetical protein
VVRALKIILPLLFILFLLLFLVFQAPRDYAPPTVAEREVAPSSESGAEDQPLPPPESEKIEVPPPQPSVPTTEPLPPPEFPWPPPRASATATFPLSLLVEQNQDTVYFEEIDQKIGSALEQCGYFERSYYAVPGGFAIVVFV